MNILQPPYYTCAASDARGTSSSEESGAQYEAIGTRPRVHMSDGSAIRPKRREYQPEYDLRPPGNSQLIDADRLWIRRRYAREAEGLHTTSMPRVWGRSTVYTRFTLTVLSRTHGRLTVHRRLSEIFGVLISSIGGWISLRRLKFRA